MKKFIVAVGLVAMSTSAALAASAAFSSRSETNTFLTQCLTKGERKTAEVAGRQNATKSGFVIFFTPDGTFVCDEQTSALCPSRCDVQTEDAE